MSEHRRKPRKPLRHSVWLHVGSGRPMGGVMSDISDSGARLDVDAPAAVPDRFILLLSQNGSARRRCLVVWRSKNQLGVRFERSADMRTQEA